MTIQEKEKKLKEIDGELKKLDMFPKTGRVFKRLDQLILQKRNIMNDTSEKINPAKEFEVK